MVWTISEVVFYAYATETGGVTNPFEGVNLRIWNGVPGAPGSTVVFGDTATNRLTSASLTTMLRTHSTAALSNTPAPGPPD